MINDRREARGVEEMYPLLCGRAVGSATGNQSTMNEVGAGSRDALEQICSVINNNMVLLTATNDFVHMVLLALFGFVIGLSVRRLVYHVVWAIVVLIWLNYSTSDAYEGATRAILMGMDTNGVIAESLGIAILWYGFFYFTAVVVGRLLAVIAGFVAAKPAPRQESISYKETRRSKYRTRAGNRSSSRVVPPSIIGTVSWLSFYTVLLTVGVVIVEEVLGGPVLGLGSVPGVLAAMLVGIQTAVKRREISSRGFRIAVIAIWLTICVIVGGVALILGENEMTAALLSLDEFVIFVPILLVFGAAIYYASFYTGEVTWLKNQKS